MIDLLLHGIALGSLCSTLIVTFRGEASGRSMWTFRLFCLAAVGFVIFTNPDIYRLTGPFYIIVRSLSAIGVGAFWLFAKSLFSRRHVRLVDALPLAALAALALPEPLLSPSASLVTKIAHGALEILLVGDVIVGTLRGADDDLVNARHALRAPFVMMIAVSCLVMTGLKVASLFGLPHTWLRTAQASITAALTIGGASAFTQIRSRLFERTRPRDLGNGSGQTSLVNEATLIQLKALIENESVWRRPSLTIGMLADQLNVPEYRVRRLINRHLGYRNFSEFLNERRVEIAKLELRDPAKARMLIATIAFDLGYASLGPFNRAFRDQTGMSPREWRHCENPESAQSD